jgi:hypothetical protein
MKTKMTKQINVSSLILRLRTRSFVITLARQSSDRRDEESIAISSCGRHCENPIFPRRCGHAWRRNRELDNKFYFYCLWPGLPELWLRGRLSALPTAVAFACALNFLLVARFIYPEWMTLSYVRIAGWVGVFAWFYCTIKNIRDLPGMIHPRKASKTPDRFADAHIAFLRSDYIRAEELLKECLGVEERDPPALLLLAAVYRQTARFEESRSCIEMLRVTEVADRWWLEVDAEEKRFLRDQAYQEGRNKVSTGAENKETKITVPNHSAIAA